MGGDLLAVKEVKETFSCASDVLGYDVADLVLNADPDERSTTRATPNRRCACCRWRIARALMARGVQPAAVLGFSLGQVSALAVSGMLSDEATFALVKARSELMAEAAAAHPWRHERVAEGRRGRWLRSASKSAEGEVLVPANFNCPGQIVIAGAPAAVERAPRRHGPRREALVAFNTWRVSIARSWPMRAAGLAAYLENVEFSEARIPLVCNVTAAPLSAPPTRARTRAPTLTSPCALLMRAWLR